MHIHNREGIALMKELGFQRVVLPRETGIEDIREYAKLGMDLEVFVQGALCVSYSGQCLMSSLTSVSYTHLKPPAVLVLDALTGFCNATFLTSSFF